MTTPASPAIQKVLSDPNFLKLSGDDQVAVLKHLQSPTTEKSPKSFTDFLAQTQQNSYLSASPTGIATSPLIPASTQAATIGSGLLPMAAPETGSGLLGFLGRVLFRSGAAGVGAGAGKMTGEAVTGTNPLSQEQLKDTAKLAGFTSAFALPFEFLGGLASTKAGQGAINKSMGTVTRDMTYGDPSRALLKEEIIDIGNGDWRAYQNSLRDGKTPTEAAQAAGGRFSSVMQRINELTPRLNGLLSKSQAQIPTANVIDKPLEDAAIEIIKNPAMGDTEKMAALGKLGELQKSMKEGLGAQLTPQQAQVLKQAVGNRVNWGGTSAVTDDVKGAYRSLYGTLKEAIHRSVPGSADIDNRLTDLLAASGTLEDAAKGEAAGNMPFSAVRLGQKEIGRVLPATTNVPAAVPAGATIGEQLLSKSVPQPAANAPALPFRPGAGLSKPTQEQ